MARTPKVSVCLLVYNHANVIESTLKTILDQSMGDYEIVVSDDCSTDGTWDLLVSMQTREPRIRPVRTPRNVGMAANANFAAQSTSGEYIALLHHDDLYRHDLLERWTRALDQFPDTGFVFNPYGNEGSAEISCIDIPDGRLDGPRFLLEHVFSSWGCPIRGTAMIRRSAWERAGGMRTEYGLLADIDLWMRLAAAGPVAYVAQPLITVRHARPNYYPDIYTGKNWSWRRQILLYLIHGANRESFYRDQPARRMLAMLVFRFRVSMETAKWISYAVWRRKSTMLRTCGESRTRFDMAWLRAFRLCAIVLGRFAPR